MTDTLFPDAPEEDLREYAQGSANFEWLRKQLHHLEEKHGEDVVVDYRIEVYRDE